MNYQSVEKHQQTGNLQIVKFNQFDNLLSLLTSQYRKDQVSFYEQLLDDSISIKIPVSLQPSKVIFPDKKEISLFFDFLKKMYDQAVDEGFYGTKSEYFLLKDLF